MGTLTGDTQAIYAYPDVQYDPYYVIMLISHIEALHKDMMSWVLDLALAVHNLQSVHTA